MIQFNRIFLIIPRSDKQMAVDIPGAKYHRNTNQYSWPVNMVETVKAHFPKMAAQVQLEYNKYMECYIKEQEALAKLRKKNGWQKPRPGGARYIREIRQEASMLEKLPGERDLLTDYENMPIDFEYEFKLKPYKHQENMFKVGMHYDKLAYFCEMGTGKTKVIVDLVNYRKVKTIVFCPKSVLSSWAQEIDKNSKLKYNIATGTRKQKLEALLDDNVDIVITNYETMVTFGNEPGLWGRFMMVVLDESSRIKNHKAKRTKLLTAAFEKTKYKYILSGTPITQNPADIWSQMNFLSDKILFNKTYYSFRNKYCIMNKFQNSGGISYQQIVGYKDLDQLKKLISRASVQLKKEECLELPPKVYQVREIEMSKEMTDQYKQMKKECILELDDVNIKAPIVLTKLLRMQEILSGKYLQVGKNEKLEELIEIIQDSVGYGRQVVVWCRFRASIAAISNRLNSLGILHSTFHGDTRDRQEMIDKFQAGEHKVFVGQIRTGGLGLNLQTGTVMVYYENNFSLEDRKQSEDRIHRIGQTKTCTYIDLVYKNTIDKKVLGAIQSKQDIATYLVNSFKEGIYARTKL